ncbi:MAG TPA: 23S rRNA (pseudouridine(1915)-N(3))-methyltransferase RlmH [Bacteroidia bacterium]|nr:23S rRNA (pseudouridine(1915)-N(3))-methyltransferase RlmH [Bacteroidia bacterium]
MKVTLLVTGKTTFPFIDKGITEYAERLIHYTSFTLHTVEAVKKTSSVTAEQVKQKEGEHILRKLSAADFLILLDDKGKEFNSVQFAAQLEKWQLQTKSIVFVIGGAYGFSDAVYQRAQAKLSLSKMTFSHQIIRVIFLEQLYRAFTIIKGEPYHHE